MSWGEGAMHHYRAGILLGIFALFVTPSSYAYDLIFRGGFEPVTDAPANDSEAARFLTQATFGPTSTSIAELRSVGYGQWLEQQLSMPPSLERPYVESLDAGLIVAGQNNRLERWFHYAITGNDQLRQRMAWALSQIMVTSDQVSVLAQDPIALAEYYDTLARDAFGTYSQLLIDVTKSPAMGQYLTYIRNTPGSPSTGTSPDENYAREVMQLFSIGLIQRNLDFSPVLDVDQTIPTYTQDTVSAYARVFTGWGYASGFYTNPRGDNYSSADYEPMVCDETYHDDDSKILLNYAAFQYSLPANNGCENDLDNGANSGLAILAAHPNVAPFISRQLIQRFTTSNPSPAYISSVANVFQNTGGDLGQVLITILTNTEATSGIAPSPYVFGKAREPLLKLTALWRYYNATAQNGLYTYSNPQSSYGQRPLGASSVFNFYLPDYLPPGDLGQAGLYGPEFQILNESLVVATANDLSNRVAAYVGGTGNYTDSSILIDTSNLLSLASDADALVSQLNHDLLYGSMSSAMQGTLVTMVNALSSSDSVGRVNSALQVLLASPEFAIQK